jgi:asparagine synthase (glutamine-hydrolysing)
MGGIAGCLALAEGVGPDKGWTARAVRRLAHRGPDGEGEYADSFVALGACRLDVLDGSAAAAARQPTRSADGRFVLVFDGFLYNYREIAADLRARGVTLRTDSDAEVLVEAYSLDGKNALRHLRGMYAFVIWDTRNRELVGCRDPFGVKPLYYSLGRGKLFQFASERKALTPAGDVPTIDPQALRHYLSFQYVPAPATMTPPVRALPAGHFFIARPGEPVDVFRYWRAVMRPAKSPMPETPERILRVMRDSVAAHLQADAPVGAFLSGGVDSAAICALAAEIRPGLPTFTVGFEREGYNEIEQAEETARALGVKSYPYLIRAAEFAQRLPEIIWHLDDPMADAAAIPLWFAAREARRHVKVVLSGEGADELFGGYGIYYQPGVVRAGQSLPSWGRSPLLGAAAKLPTGVKGKGLLKRISVPLRERYIGNALIFTDDQVDRLARFQGGYASDITAPLYDQAEESGLDDVATMQLVDINTWLPGDILVKADRVSGAHGIQLRSPYVDREVMAVASRLARAEKTAANTTKFAFREAMSSVLPHESAERANLGFPVPLGYWLTRELAGYAEQVLVEARTEEWFNKRAVLNVLQRFESGDPEVGWRQVWTLLVFSLWHQIYVERVFDPVKLGWSRPAPARSLGPAQGSPAPGPAPAPPTPSDRRPGV